MKLNQFSLPFMLLLLLLSVASNSVLGSIAQISRHCIGQALLGLSITTTTDNEFITPTISYYDSSSSTSSYSLPPESDNWSFGSSRSYIYGGKQALYALSKQISESQSSSSPSSSSSNSDNNIESEISSKSTLSFTEIYNEIGKIETTYQLKRKLAQFMLESSNLSSNSYSCVQTSADKAIYDINTINEYFSISNDGMKKVMIADSFQGQKLQFIMQGLASLQADLQAILFCSASS